MARRKEYKKSNGYEYVNVNCHAAHASASSRARRENTGIRKQRAINEEGISDSM
ncbi:hypothetical protein CCACVL1_15692 [Corchorus capsularis]|uniref:Uncharacterized protein n=1 Tax=Corchorus capsularis TaxID=210143 RepID=A0A1R3I1M2_COCAP|nr:hypothetical protein CCACVL1_15692 [Corchorus capsularis]